MSALEIATKFVNACDGLQGWNACKEFVSDGAVFVAQCEPLVEVNTVEGYYGWLDGVCNGPLQGSKYEINSSSYDEKSRTAVFFSTFTATHTGGGGPVEPTDKETVSHYVYAVTMNEAGKVEKMTKIWNAPWCLKELGWM
jgi:hypothetical protein